jgi:hypothetical protein
VRDEIRVAAQLEGVQDHEPPWQRLVRKQRPVLDQVPDSATALDLDHDRRHGRFTEALEEIDLILEPGKRPSPGSEEIRAFFRYY